MKKIMTLLSILVLCLIIYTMKIYISFDIEEFKNSLNERYSQVVLDDKEDILGVYLNKNEEWKIKSEEDISKKLKIAVLTYEDKRFYSHPGVDILSILRAVRDNIRKSKRSGASTITMQGVKLANPKPRTYINKYREIIESLKLEKYLSKEEILLIYMNNAPYGGNIRGYKTASLMYFGKSPKELTWAEGSLLAVLPNSPGMMNIEKNREKLILKRNNLLKKLWEEGKIDKIQYEMSKREPLPLKKEVFVNHAPHLTRRLTRNSKEKIILSTINREIQLKIEKEAKIYGRYLKTQGINNLSVLVVENKTYEAKAYLGSGGFFDSPNGQVDGIISKRSPGSLLKPFLFAKAIDEGLIARESKVFDIPRNYSNYSPQNANKKYKGIIEIDKALISSLNLPFVDLLKEYGETKFFYFLKDVLGFPEKDASHYGLSLILGTKEITVEEVAKLYTGLGNYGKFRDIRFTKSEINKSKREAITEGSSYLTLDTLRKLERPVSYEGLGDRGSISWKTGTSYGRRDGWAVGVSPSYTVAVWVGNFDGSRSPNLSGVESAGTLLFNIFNNLDETQEEFQKRDIKIIEVDNETGYRTNYCLLTRKILYPISAKPLRLSPYYKTIYVNKDGIEVDSRDKEFKNSSQKIILNYPLEVIRYLKENKMDTEKIYNEGSKEKSLGIIYPTPNLSLSLPQDIDGKKSLIVKIANLKNQNVYWYLNNKYLGEGKEKERSLDLEKGDYVLTLVGENGERVREKFKVEAF